MKTKSLFCFLLACCFLLSGCKPAESVLDAEPHFTFETENRRGNTNGNIANLGLAASQGDWIFFCDMADEGRLKATRDGTNCVELMADLNDTYACLNVVGQSISYISSAYSDINAVLLDESTAVNLWAGHSYCMQVYDGDIWFIDESDDGLIKRLDDETGETTTYGSHPAFVEGVTDADRHAGFSLDDGWLYYVAADDNNRIYRVSLSDGTEEAVADVSATVMIADGGRVWYTDADRNNRLFYLYNGNTVSVTEGSVGTFNVEGRTVWYTDRSQSGSPVMKYSAGLATRVCDAENTLYIARVNGMLVLYCTDGDENDATYFVSDDGTCIRPA